MPWPRADGSTNIMPTAPSGGRPSTVVKPSTRPSRSASAVRRSPTSDGWTVSSSRHDAMNASS